MPAEGGIRFGNYVLLRRVARGGMAEVFLAQQRGLEGFDRRVAVKRILPHLADSPDFLKMFLGEAKLAAQLAHPNIVHIYDFGKVDTDYFIAMEFVEGVHAGQLFKLGPGQRLPPTMVARLGADAAAALHYAHEQRNAAGKLLGLVHRDVSPANLMVSFDGAVKLCDFGIAKAAALGDQLTNPGQVKGKYAYMSPEQTIAGPLDGRSDVFSLAIVLWELLAGRFIVDRGDAVEAMRAIRDGRIEPISRAAPGTPAALAEALAWALETDRDDRATAADLAQALEAFIKSSPELATPMQLAAFVRQHFPREALTSQVAALTPHTGVPMARTPSGGNTQGTAIAHATQVGSKSTALPRVPDDDTTIAAGPPAMTTVAGDPAAEPSGPQGPTVIVERRSPPRDITELLPAAPPRAPSIADGDAPTLPRSGHHVAPVGDASARAPTSITPQRMAAMSPRGRRARLALAIGSLIALGVFSFLVVLAARGRGHAGGRGDAGVRVAASDARAIVAIAPAIDAVVAAIDAPPAPAPPDAAAPAPEPDAAAPAPPPPEALVEIKTRPDHASIRLGGQKLVAPARLALPAGTYTLVVELAGYQPERRELAIERGDHPMLEIALVKKQPAQHVEHATGRLNIRTSPYSDVYEGDKYLGQAPFEVELAVGPHRLTFKNPSHATVSKTITIEAGKARKLNFPLP